MSKRLCFVYTETNGLHNYNGEVNKKKLYCYARLVSLNYEIGVFKNNQFHLEKKVKQIVRPRCMVIPQETVEYHGITQEYANANGTDPEQVITTFNFQTVCEI